MASKEEDVDAPKEEAEPKPDGEVIPPVTEEEKAASEDQEESSEPQADGATLSDIKKVVHGTKVKGGKSVWAMTLETLGMAEGKKKKEDVICYTLENALSSIKTMLDAVKDEHPKWQFTLTPLDQFKDATMDDVLRAFVMWSRKDGETTYNVSNAFRRLETYATWMEEHREDLEAPLTVDSIRNAAHAWQIKLSHDSQGRVVWWIDASAIDTKAIKNGVPPRDSLRFVVWQSHLVMLDRKAQENGILLIQAMGEKGMMETFKMVPMDLGTQLDRLTIGVLPLRCSKIYVYNHLRWMGILMGLMKPFMSKKMRERVVVIPRKADPSEAIEKEVGKEAIPVGFADLEGTLEDDIVFGQYIK